jgi:hypothetical protein
MFASCVFDVSPSEGTEMPLRCLVESWHIELRVQQSTSGFLEKGSISGGSRRPSGEISDSLRRVESRHRPGTTREGDVVLYQPKGVDSKLKGRVVTPSWEPNVTVAIAAIVPTQEAQIVTVSDQRVSYGDSLPSTDSLRKNGKIALKWGMLFAATNITAFQPVYETIQKELNFSGDIKEFDADHMRTVAETAYRQEFEKCFYDEHLARFGYKDVTEFRHDGLHDLGQGLYGDYAEKLARFDLGLELLIYGYDSTGKPHIFEVCNPGKIINHDLRCYAAIGSGSQVAFASLNRKNLLPDLEDTIYRLLDAKFSSEATRDVGKATDLITLNRHGSYGIASSVEIEAIRKVWDTILAQLSPNDAMSVIRTSKVVRGIIEGGET